MRALLLSLALALTLAPVATAATVSFAQGDLYTDDGADGGLGGCSRYAQCGTLRVVTLTAAPGEANDVTASLADPVRPLSELTLRDAGAALSLDASAMAACTATAPGEVRCRTGQGGQGGSEATRVVVHAGDGDDRVATASPLQLTADGGAGEDDLRAAGSGRAQLDGGADDDVLAGGGGYDVITGGAGNDVITGGAGDDGLTGGAGDDLLVGGSGTDGFVAGSGNDTVRARDGRAEGVSCGSGTRDRVATRDRRDRLRGCERLP